MNKFITPLPSGGLPITNEDLLMIQNEAHEAITAVCAGMDAGFVLSGCIASQTGVNVSITAGYVFLDNQVMKFSGYEGIYPVYIKAGTPSNIQRVFKDGVSKNVTTDTVAVSILTPPLSGSYITYNPQPDKTLKSVIVAGVSKRVDDEITARINGDTTLNSRITNEVNALSNNKANRTQPAWTNMTLNINYSTSSGGWEHPSYMQDDFGFVHLRGMVRMDSSAANGNVFFTLPEGHRPQKTLYFMAGVDDTNYQTRVMVASNGNISVWTKDPDNMATFTMDGMNFHIS